MAINATYVSNLTVVETLETGVPAVGTGTASITHSAYNLSVTAKATGGTVVGTKFSAMSQALTAGAHTIDLTALPGTNGATVDGTGLKVKIVKFLNPAGNAAMTFKFGASNPYLLGGDAAWRKTLPAGGESLEYYVDANGAVGGGAKNIDVSGTGTQIFKVEFVLGT